MIKYKQSDIGFTETYIDLHLNNWTLLESALNRIRNRLIPKLNLVGLKKI